MTPRKFPSKIDPWLMILLVALIGVQAMAMGTIAFQAPRTADAVISIVVMLLAIALIGSLLKGTYYSVEGSTLKVVSGPFRWKVPIDEITSITPTRSLWSSPALSLDRLRITWGPNNRKIIVSPADKAGFVKALGMELTR